MSQALRLRKQRGVWLEEAFDLPASEPPTAAIVVHGVLIPPGSDTEGYWVGSPVGTSQRVGGWGELVSIHTADPATLTPLPHLRDTEEALFALVAATVDGALTHLPRAVERAAVPKNVPWSTLVEGVLRAKGVEVVAAPTSPVPLLVDTTGTVETWNKAMVQLEPDGMFVGLLPPRPAQSDFDFYPQVHRRSLWLRVRCWSDLERPTTTYVPPTDLLHRLTDDRNEQTDKWTLWLVQH